MINIETMQQSISDAIESAITNGRFLTPEGEDNGKGGPSIDYALELEGDNFYIILFLTKDAIISKEKIETYLNSQYPTYDFEVSDAGKENFDETGAYTLVFWITVSEN